MFKKTLSVFLAVMLAVTAIPFFRLESTAAISDIGDPLMQSIFNGTAVKNETVMFLDKGEVKSLLFPIDSIQSVTSYDGTIVYQEGVDYELVNGNIKVTANSSIPCITSEVFYNYTGSILNVYHNGQYVPTYWGEGNTMTRWQVNVNYTHSTQWTGYTQECEASSYQTFINKLENGQDVTVFFYGDSITHGANASFFCGHAPYQGTYSMLFTQTLADIYGYTVHYVQGGLTSTPPVPSTDYVGGTRGTITYVNTAVGGWTSQDGVDNLTAYVTNKIATYGCDFFLSGFGMNDGGVDPAETVANTKQIVDAVLSMSSDAAIVLMATMVPNINGLNWYGNQKYQEAALQTLAQEYKNKGVSCAVACMTSVSLALLDRKDYHDHTGNNVNHPNDFMSRVYAQTLFQTVIGYENLPSYHNNIDDTPGMTSKDTSSKLVVCEAILIEGDLFYVQGWSVHESGLSAYQASVDGGAWSNITSGFRQDVYNAMADYTACTDINSFTMNLDTSGMESGKHTLEIRGVTKTGATYGIATYNIELWPTEGSAYMTVLSNALAPGGNFKITAKGTSAEAWVGLFGIDETPGTVYSYYWYEMGTEEVTFDLLQDGVSNDRGELAPGLYKLVLFADGGSSMPIYEEAVVVVGEVQYSLDTKGPYEVIQGETVAVRGWGASKDGMKGYAYSIDGVRASDYLTTNQRQDVITHLTNSGYSVTISDVHAFHHDISTANMTPGTHTISVIGITSDDVEFDIGTVEVIVAAPAVVEKIEGSVTIDRDTDADTAYITDIDLNTTAEELLAKLTNDGCVIKDKDGNAAVGKLSTGCTVELIVDGVVHDKAVIIVKADLDGDAMATSKDVILAKMYRQSQTGGNVAKLASDFDGNGTVSAADMTSIAQAVVAN